MKPGCNVAPLVERFFTERLVRQQDVSVHTIASYRDTFRLLLKFAMAKLRKAPSDLTLDELDAVLAGLGALERAAASHRAMATSARELSHRLAALARVLQQAASDAPGRPSA